MMIIYHYDTQIDKNNPKLLTRDNRNGKCSSDTVVRKILSILLC